MSRSMARRSARASPGVKSGKSSAIHSVISPMRVVFEEEFRFFFLPYHGRRRGEAESTSNKGWEREKGAKCNPQHKSYGFSLLFANIFQLRQSWSFAEAARVKGLMWAERWFIKGSQLILIGAFIEPLEKKEEFRPQRIRLNPIQISWGATFSYPSRRSWPRVADTRNREPFWPAELLFATSFDGEGDSF